MAEQSLSEQRERLLEAWAIIQCVRLAMATNLEGLSETAVVDALHAANRLIDNAAAALEGK